MNNQKTVFNNGITKIGDSTYFYGFRNIDEYHKENYTLWRFKNAKIYIKNDLGFNIENIKLNQHINFNKDETLLYAFYEKLFIPWIPIEFSFDKNYDRIYTNMKVAINYTSVYYYGLIISIDNDFLSMMSKVNVGIKSNKNLKVSFDGGKYFVLDMKKMHEINLSDIDALQKLLIDEGDFNIYALRCI